MMKNDLFIVESPSKISKIKQYLPTNNYIVKASCGHVQDLDSKTLSIDINDNFKPFYVINPDKKKLVSELVSLANNCDNILLASDGDREGEFIAYSLANLIKNKNIKRIVFNEITKNAIIKALDNPKTINMNMVYSQETRRKLDRLWGYSISPVLTNHFGGIQSAGRVQSIVLKIIIDKEKEINDCISEVYLKTIGEFKFNNNKIISTLTYNNKNYLFDNFDIANNFIKTINKSVIFKVIDIENKISIRKPSFPFITSTLLQEASTKLNFNIKKTMEIAQKLYEAGYITYMRTDCPSISIEAKNNIEKLIIDKYGKEYSGPKDYSSKNSNSQDAHECIRPTYINKELIEDLTPEAKKLYSLIWKRTIASQMSNAKINVQTIKIDALLNNTSILIFKKDNPTYFLSTFENIEFSGYLIVYDNTKNDSDNESQKKPNIDIKINDIVSLFKIKISEEFTRLPLRYNESLLIKFLEKNSIGRPSTYSNIMTKLIERNYIEIKDVEGIKSKSKIIELDNKFKIKEIEKDIIIGKENKKMVSTENGQKINEYLNLHFFSILTIDFTAKFEIFLDKISIGEANPISVLKQFFDMFYPIVEKLKVNIIPKSLTQNADTLLGINKEGCEIFKGTGQYGPYVKIKINDKWKYASIKENINLDLKEAIELLSFPRFIGKVNSKLIYLYNGKFGYYIKYMDKNIAIKTDNIDEINTNYISNLISKKKNI